MYRFWLVMFSRVLMSRGVKIATRANVGLYENDFTYVNAFANTLSSSEDLDMSVSLPDFRSHIRAQSQVHIHARRISIRS